jgi:hypothetical protein
LMSDAGNAAFAAKPAPSQLYIPRDYV